MRLVKRDHDQKKFDYGSGLFQLYKGAKDRVKGGRATNNRGTEEIKNDIKQGEEAVWQNFHPEEAKKIISGAREKAQLINKGK